VPQMYTVTVLIAVTEARKLKAPPMSAPVVLLTATGWPTIAPVTVAVPESQLALKAVPVIVPVVPERTNSTLPIELPVFPVAVGGITVFPLIERL